MRIQLPNETWIEILDWLKRRDLVKKLEKLWDSQFTPIVQDWLHKYTRNVRIEKLLVDTDGLFVHLMNNDIWKQVPIAKVDLPGNVTGFKNIEIKYFDSNVLLFLRRIRRLFSNVHLRLESTCTANGMQNVRTAFRHLLPLIGNQPFEALSLPFRSLLSLLHDINFRIAIFNAKLLNIYLFQRQITQFLVSWLFAGLKDGQPRVLLLKLIWDDDDDFDGFIANIQLHFLNPDRQSPSPFFLRFHTNATVIESNNENVRTGEQLTIRNFNHDNKNYKLITNCSLNVDPAWLTNKTEEILGWKLCNQQQTILLNHLQIGPIDDGDVSHPEQPGTSRNAQKLEEEEESFKKKTRLI